MKEAKRPQKEEEGRSAESRVACGSDIGYGCAYLPFSVCTERGVGCTVLERRMSHRIWRESKQQLS